MRGYRQQYAASRAIQPRWPAVERCALTGSRARSGVVSWFVLYLIYAELFSIGAICLWCTSVHVITFALFVLIVFGAAAGYGTTKALSRA